MLIRLSNTMNAEPSQSIHSSPLVLSASGYVIELSFAMKPVPSSEFEPKIIGTGATFPVASNCIGVEFTGNSTPSGTGAHAEVSPAKS